MQNERKANGNVFTIVAALVVCLLAAPALSQTCPGSQGNNAAYANCSGGTNPNGSTARPSAS